MVVNTVTVTCEEVSKVMQTVGVYKEGVPLSPHQHVSKRVQILGVNKEGVRLSSHQPFLSQPDATV